MAQSDETDAGPAPGASGETGQTAKETPAGRHNNGSTASSTPAPGESKSGDPSLRSA